MLFAGKYNEKDVKHLLYAAAEMRCGKYRIFNFVKETFVAEYMST